MSKQQKEPNEYEEYHVTWEVEVGGATSHRHAAQLALEMMQDPDSEATAFTVLRYKDDVTKDIDLMQDDET